MDQQTNTKKKMKKWQKVTLIVALSVIAVLLIAFIGLYALFSRYYGMTNYDPLDGTDEIILDIGTEDEEPWDDELDETEEPDDLTTPDTGSVTTPNTGTNTAPSTGTAVTPNTGTTSPVTTPKPVTTTPKTPTTTEKVPEVKPSFTITKPSYIAGDEKEYKETELLANALVEYRMSFGSHIKNILLIGNDSYSVTERGRSDSMILVSINERSGQIKLTSLPRDLYVFIPGLPAEYSFNRLNASYAHGGVPMLIDTIEVNLKIKIDKYARVNFTAFTDIINTMGGIEVELKQSEIDYMAKYGTPLPEGTKPGMVKLNGAQALNYCRCRKVTKYDPAKGKDVSGDFARTLRQRTFLNAAFEKVKTLSLAEIDALLEKFLPYITHNFTKTEILGYVSKLPQYLSYDLVAQNLLGTKGYTYATIDGRSVYKTNFKKTWQNLEKYINS